MLGNIIEVLYSVQKYVLYKATYSVHFFLLQNKLLLEYYEILEQNLVGNQEKKYDISLKVVHLRKT